MRYARTNESAMPGRSQEKSQTAIAEHTENSTDNRMTLMIRSRLRICLVGQDVGSKDRGPSLTSV